MTKLIQERINVIDPNWKEPWYDRLSLMSYADYIRNEKVDKLFKDRMVLNWQVDGGYIWLEIKD